MEASTNERPPRGPLTKVRSLCSSTGGSASIDWQRSDIYDLRFALVTWQTQDGHVDFRMLFQREKDLSFWKLAALMHDIGAEIARKAHGRGDVHNNALRVDPNEGWIILKPVKGYTDEAHLEEILREYFEPARKMLLRRV
jgi:hypothetical protein